MAGIERALELYSLMAQRCEKSGADNNQARVYRELIDFMSDCQTLDEAIIKIKNSDYYLAPSVALMRDRISTLMNAADMNGMPEVAEVYAKKLSEIYQDVSAIYDSSFEVTANNLKARYVSTMEGFGQIYDAYVMIREREASDTNGIETALNDMRKGFDKLDLPTSDFQALCKIPSFRSLIPANDRGIERFMLEVPVMLTNGVNRQNELTQIKTSVDEEWEEVLKHKAEIMALGKENLSKIKNSRTTVVAPSDEKGSYSFINEEVY